jgi:hypothetical protein
MQRTRISLSIILVLLLLALSAPIAAEERDTNKRERNPASLPNVIWRDSGNVASLNLLYGVGGKEHAPDPNGKYTFVKEDLEGTSPKFDVKDAQGVQWKVKLGQEPQSETAATRLMWAAGYFTDEDYYLPELKVTGLPKLHRGKSFASADGTVRRARLKRHQKGLEKLGNWDWFDNPFLDNREMNGLRVMMSLLNNWDLKKINNAIYEVNSERHYMVSDVGATFGKTGNTFSRSKSVLKDYAGSKFIRNATPQYVDFVMRSRPFFLAVFDLPNYRNRTRMEKVTRRVPRADAKWLGGRLSQLSEEQIRDCFRAAGYGPEEVEGYTKAVQKRIAELNAL